MSNITIAIIAGLLGMLGWGISDFFAKKTIDKIGDLKTLIGSQLIGGVLFLILLIITHSPIPTVITKNALLIVLGMAALDGAGYLLLYRAFQKGIVSIVSPIAASAAGVAALVSLFIFGEKLTVTGIIGLILIFSGIIITSTDFSDLKKSLSRENLSKGVPEALGTMVLIGFWFPLWDRFVKGGEYLFWLILLKLSMSVLLIIYFYLTSHKENLLTGYKSVIKILIPVAILDALAYFGTSWGYSVSTNVTSIITVIANAYSVPTIILAYLLLRERITKSQLVGIFGIIAGIIISSVR